MSEWLPALFGQSHCNAHPHTHQHADPRGTRAVQTLHGVGFTDVREMQGGLRAWQREGYPVVQGE